MNPRQLGLKRLKYNGLYQYRAIRSALDWTVMLYFIVPGLLLGIRGYYSLWAEPLPQWIVHTPFALVAAAVFFFLRMGVVRVLLEPGDALFLLQKKAWMRTVAAIGCTYSIIVQFLGNALIWVILLPVLLRIHDITMVGWMLLLCYSGLYKTVYSFLSNHILISYSSWRRWIASAGYTILGGLLFIVSIVQFRQEEAVLSVGCAVLLGILLYLFRRRMRLANAFERDVVLEREYRLKWTAFLLRDTLDRSPWFQTRRPVIFRRSNRFFKFRASYLVFAEICIKSFFRSKLHLKTYAQFLAISIIALFLTPLQIRIIVFVGLIALMIVWIRGVWREFIRSSYVQLFRWSDQVLLSAYPIVLYGSVLPAAVLFGLAFGITLFEWWGIPLGLLLGVGGSWLMVQVMKVTFIRK